MWSVEPLQRTRSASSLATVQLASRLSLGGRRELPPSLLPPDPWAFEPGLQHLPPAPSLSGTSTGQSPSILPTILHHRQDLPSQQCPICSAGRTLPSTLRINVARQGLPRRGHQVLAEASSASLQRQIDVPSTSGPTVSQL